MIGEDKIQSLYQLFQAKAEQTPETVALFAPGRPPLRYAQLLGQIDHIVASLNILGISRNDRVALVLPDGPDMAAAILGVAAGATCAPLNPAYRLNEFQSLFRDLRPKALVIHSGGNGAAVAAARECSLPIIEWSQLEAKTPGSFENLNSSRRGLASSKDVALIFFTSGTTSRPKLVPLTHANLTASAASIAASLQITQEDRCLNIMPLFHVHGLVGGLLASFAAGASVICAPGFYAPGFFDWLEEFCPTWYTATPTIHQLILARVQHHRDTIRRCPLRFIRSSSAILPLGVMAELEETFGVPVIESYGMTEAAHQMTSNPLPPRERKRGSVGVATGPELAIMNDAGDLLPTATVGEVVVRGANVMNGYGQSTDSNATAFTLGWFRTGDVGYLDGDGYLFLTGRIKELINRGGEKIAPQEVDGVLMEHPAVLQAVTFAVPDTTLGEEVAAAVVLRRQAQVTARELREFSATRLSDFKVPRQIAIVKELPQSSTGKLQRAGLAEKLRMTAIDSPLTGTTTVFELPQTPLETEIAGIWAQVLGLRKIGRHDNFLRLGGDSILAAQIVARLSAAVGVEISMVDLFEAHTVMALAQVIEAKDQIKDRASTPIRSLSRDRVFPVSYAQEAVWFLHQLEPNAGIYNRPLAFRLTGLLDVMALEQSFNEMLRRHEALRTAFPLIDGKPAQAIMPAELRGLSILDLTSLHPTEREARLSELAAEEVQRPFDLVKGPLLRAHLFILDEQENVLLVTLHHITFDGWSSAVFFHELGKIYTAITSGQPIMLPHLPVQYADFTVWQREQMQGQRLEGLLAYWKRQLGGELPRLELATDRLRKDGETQHLGAHHRINLSADLSKSLKALSQNENATLFMTLLAAFNSLLYRYTGQEDLLVGSPIAGRNREETEGILGNFVNMLVLRNDLSGNPSFRELLRRVLEVTLQAYAHQELPLVKLAEELHFDRTGKIPAPFRVIFELRNLPRRTMEFGGLVGAPFALDDGLAQLDLSLEIVDNQDELSGIFEYDTCVFDATTIARMANHFQILLAGIIANPDQSISALPILTETERHQLLVEWNDTTIDYPKDKCIHELFEAQVKKSPDTVAVVFEDEQLTYRELNQRANQLACYLRKLEVGAETLVGLCVERSLEMIVGLLGILKSGGAYVPLDPDYPKERLKFMLADTRASVLLTQQRLIENLPMHSARLVCLDRDWGEMAHESEKNLEHGATANNLAYVIYTSGSTGRPKAVMMSHAAICNHMFWMQMEFPLTETDRVVQKTAYSFDVSAAELFAPLLAGARLVVAQPGKQQDSSYLINLMAQKKVTVLHAVPSLLRLLLEENGIERCTRLKHVFCGGEALSLELQECFFNRLAANLYNLCGPTETCVESIFWTCRRGRDQRTVPIGRPIANTQIYLLDRHQQPVPVGVTGELYIGGTGLGRGYLNCPEMTAEKFLPDPFTTKPGGRLYRTGDLARYLPDGTIEFLGRIDHQVKIRGFRIELGEIESVLRQHPAVRDTVVMALEDTSEDPSGTGKRLVAYVARSTDQSLTINAVRTFLKMKLPDYMIPTVFVFLDAFPLTPNGKIDRRALPPPDQRRPELETSFTAPRTAMEERLVQIWREVLELDKVGIHDNFFDLGGHSLRATQVVSRIRQLLQLEVPLRTLFEAPTIEELAAVITEHGGKQLNEDHLNFILRKLESVTDQEAQDLLSSES